MNHFKQIFLGSLICVSLLMLAPGTKAGEWDEETHVTFSGPVEIPGHVLPAGTYVFKLLPDEVASRNVVQVTNADQSRVIALELSIPRYRTGSIDNSLFVLEERDPNTPQAIQAWYYPGHSDGHQFIYRGNAMPVAATASSTPTPAATTPNAVEGSAPAASNETNVTEPAAEATAQSAQNTDQNQNAQSQTTPNASSTAPAASTDQTQTNQDLPKSASSTPLVALIGMLLVGGALGLKAIATCL